MGGQPGLYRGQGGAHQRGPPVGEQKFHIVARGTDREDVFDPHPHHLGAVADVEGRAFVRIDRRRPRQADEHPLDPPDQAHGHDVGNEVLGQLVEERRQAPEVVGLAGQGEHRLAQKHEAADVGHGEAQGRPKVQPDGPKGAAVPGLGRLGQPPDHREQQGGDQAARKFVGDGPPQRLEHMVGAAVVQPGQNVHEVHRGGDPRQSPPGPPEDATAGTGRRPRGDGAVGGYGGRNGHRRHSPKRW